MLFEINTKGHKHPSIRLFIIEQDTCHQVTYPMSAYFVDLFVRHVLSVWVIQKTYISWHLTGLETSTNTCTHKIMPIQNETADLLPQITRPVSISDKSSYRFVSLSVKAAGLEFHRRIRSTAKLQIPKLFDHLNYQCCGIYSSWDTIMRHLIGYRNRNMII